MNSKIVGTIFIVILCVFVVFAIYIFMYFSFDKNIENDTEKWALKLNDHKLESLLNGSSINNIPNLNLITTNAAVRRANDCSRGPVYIGDNGTDHDCIKTCSNSSASVINVGKTDTYIYDSAVLRPGASCIIGKRPECNMKTTYAMMTINSVVCRSKFPEIVGGPFGSTVVACNNKSINDPQNYLWDYKYNKKYDPLTTIITDPNEVLEDGTYRLRCKFIGTDIKNNKYFKHPYNRFQPFRNYCASNIFNAHPTIKTVFKKNGTYKCNCGDKKETRMKNLNPNDTTTVCAPVNIKEKIDKKRTVLTFPYKCFTLFSPLEDVAKYLPCPGNSILQHTSYSSINIPYSIDLDAPIEHPRYKELSDSGVQVVPRTV